MYGRQYLLKRIFPGWHRSEDGTLPIGRVDVGNRVPSHAYHDIGQDQVHRPLDDRRRQAVYLSNKQPPGMVC